MWMTPFLQQLQMPHKSPARNVCSTLVNLFLMSNSITLRLVTYMPRNFAFCLDITTMSMIHDRAFLDHLNNKMVFPTFIHSKFDPFTCKCMVSSRIRQCSFKFQFQGFMLCKRSKTKAHSPLCLPWLRHPLALNGGYLA